MSKNENKNKLFNKIVLIIISLLLVISLVINILNFKQSRLVEYKNDENIVFFGDSITYGYDVKKFYPSNNVINSGINGNKTEDLINRIDSDLYRYNPSKVFLLIGINDLCRYVDEEDILYNIQTIINGIKSNRKYSEIYVESIYPLSHKKFEEQKYEYCSDIDNSKIMKINKKIKEMCIESDVTYIDLYSKLEDGNGELKELYTYEGLHLNDLGYLKVTSVLDKYINN